MSRTEQSGFIKEFLQNKDSSEVKEAVPNQFRMSTKDKKASLFLDGLASQYSVEASAGCIKHCFTNLDSAIVSQHESDCMTNCTSKAMESLSFFQINMTNMH